MLAARLQGDGPKEGEGNPPPPKGQGPGQGPENQPNENEGSKRSLPKTEVVRALRGLSKCCDTSDKSYLQKNDLEWLTSYFYL